MLAGTRAYEKVDQEEQNEPLSPSSFTDFPPRREQRRRPWARGLEIASKTLICLFAAYGFYNTVLRGVSYVQTPAEHKHNHATDHNNTTPTHEPHPNHVNENLQTALQTPVLREDGFVRWPDHKSCSCGKTIEEAESMGCIFDSMNLAWLPEHCRDDELTAEFETLGPGPGGAWELFEDPEGTIPLNFSYVSRIPGKEFYMTMEWHDMHCAYTWRRLYRSRVLGKTLDKKSDGLHHIGHCTGEFLRRDPLQALTTLGHMDLDAENPIKE